MQSRNPAVARAGRPFGRVVEGLVSGTVLAMAAGLLGLLGAPAQAASADEVPTGSDLTIVQANIYSGLTVPRFQADVRKVLDLRPDFITYNEVPLRNDLVMAPPAEGWAIHRSKQNRYTAATAVAWRTDRWTMIDSGTHRISNYRGKPPGRKIELGRRFANWVTLTAPDGRVLSVVSVHVAPLTRGMPDLRRRSVRNLGDLVAELAPRGPVLVGGDFNVHYKSGIYPRDLLTAADLVPTYDMLGTWFPTGDHQGATIDYLFNRGSAELWADNHRSMELKSDHDAVIAGFSWQTDAPAETQAFTSAPGGELAERRAALQVLVDNIRAAEPGSIVEVVTAGFDQRAMARQLRKAVARGVHVRLTTRSEVLTARERRVSRAIAASADSESWLRQCLDECLVAWGESGMAPGFMMVSDHRQRWTVRIDSDRVFDPDLVDKPTRVVVRTGEYGLADGAQLLSSVY